MNTSNKPSKTSPLPPSSIQKGRVSLSMLKGRPGSVSVPSFTFRFNPTDDSTLEELGELGECATEARENGEESTTAPATAPTSESRVASTPPPSPPGNGSSSSIKGKRALSLDGTCAADSSPLESWSLLNKIKGGLARKVEEAKKYRLEFQTGNLLKKEPVIKSLERGSSTESAVEDAVPDIFAEVQQQQQQLQHGATVVEQPTAVNAKEEISVSQKAPLVVQEPELPEAVELRLRKSTSGNTEEALVTFSRSSKTEMANEIESRGEAKTLGTTATTPLTTPSSTTSSSSSSSSQRGTTRQLSVLFKTKYACCSALILMIIMGPLSDFVHGLLIGVLLTVGTVYLWMKVFWHRDVPLKESTRATATLDVTLPDGKPEKPGGKKGWMNELLMDYSLEDFHLNHTHAAYVRLDGCILRVAYQKSKVPKRAMWNEIMSIPNFDHQRNYNLEGAKVLLLPEGLASKRFWSRRYPILIITKEGPDSRESMLPSHLKKKNAENHVVLFPRSGREKEEWYWLLQAAAEDPVNTENVKLCRDYSVYMSRLLPSPNCTPLSDQKPKRSSSSHSTSSTVVDIAWLNALLGRIFWDFKNANEWVDLVSSKIQRKLNTIRVPYFINALHLSELDLGTRLPEVESIEKPVLDDRGLWIETKIVYYGNFRMTLETKLDLMKLKKDPTDTGIELGQEPSSPSLSDVSTLAPSAYDSDAEESAESSSDEDASGEPSEGVVNDDGGGSTGRKLLRIVDSIAQSRYFQQASEYKFLKKAMEGVSNTRLMLTVELVSLSGKLVLNIPPPPSDRLWYGFRGNPELSLSVKPKVGEWNVQFTYILEWIRNKLILEFQRILVLPNMDDLILPITKMRNGFPTDPEGSRSTTPTS